MPLKFQKGNHIMESHFAEHNVGVAGSGGGGGGGGCRWW